MNKINICGNHANILAKQHEELYKKKKLVDITLIAGLDGTAVETHRNVLSAWSGYFNDALSQSNSVEIKLENINGKVLNSIVDFMYSGSIKIDRENFKDILQAADFLKINNLTTSCFAIIIEDLLLDYNNYGYSEVKHESVKHVYNNLDRVCIQEAFFLLNEQQLNKLLSDDYIQRVPQGKLFDSLIAWYRHDKENRGDLMRGLLSTYVDFKLLEGRPVVLEWNSPVERIITQVQKIVYIEERNGQLRIHIFNPKLKTWSYQKLKWSKIEDSLDYAIAVLNNKIIFSGGYVTFGDFLADADCLDLETMQFSPMRPMRTERFNHIMTEVYDNAYVVGGQFNHSDTAYLRSVEMYNFRKGKWENKTPLPGKVQVDVSAALNGILYVGSRLKFWLDCYDTRTDKWARTASWKRESTIISMAAVRGFLYMVGSKNNVGLWENVSSVLSQKASVCIQRYDPSNDTWTVIKSPQLAGYWISCISCNDHLLIGANTKKEILEFQEYDPLAEEWKISIPAIKLSHSYKKHLCSIKEYTINS